MQLSHTHARTHARMHARTHPTHIHYKVQIIYLYSANSTYTMVIKGTLYIPPHIKTITYKTKLVYTHMILYKLDCLHFSAMEYAHAWYLRKRCDVSPKSSIYCMHLFLWMTSPLILTSDISDSHNCCCDHIRMNSVFSILIFSQFWSIYDFMSAIEYSSVRMVSFSSVLDDPANTFFNIWSSA